MKITINLHHATTIDKAGEISRDLRVYLRKYAEYTGLEVHYDK